MAVENVPQLCDALMESRQEREDMLTTGQLPTTTEDKLTDLDNDGFLDNNLQAVDDWLANQVGTEFEQISVLEVNALLASVQNSYGLIKRDAFARRFGRLEQQQRLYKERGVLDDQMKLVGTLIDPPAALQLSGPDNLDQA